MTKRTLSLKRESILDLTIDELGVVVGGQDARTLANTCPILECVNSRYVPCTV
jgi:hypothetical protein